MRTILNKIQVTLKRCITLLPNANKNHSHLDLVRENPGVWIDSTGCLYSSRNPMLYGKTGGEGVGWVGRYLWYIPHSEKAK
jgi:hypothetical protein